MAEERLIDDDKDRKYKIRKNADGEDELYIDDSSEDENEEQSSIPLFEVPYGDDDDDDAEALTPEQFAERERLKREEQLAREKQAASLLSEADKKLGSGNFEGARFAAAQAAEINPKSGGAYCTQLKALSRNFTDFTSLEDCLEAADGVKQYADKEQKSALKNLASGLKKRIDEVGAEARELSEKNEAAKAERGEVFAAQSKRAFVVFLAAAIPFAVLSVLTLIFACNIFAEENGAFVIATIVCGSLDFIALVATLITARRDVTARRRVKQNEKNTTTKLGREYVEKAEELERLNTVYSSFDI